MCKYCFKGPKTVSHLATPSLSDIHSLPVLGLSEELLVNSMYEDRLIPVQSHCIAILQSQLPQITGSRGTQLAVAEQEPN